MKIFYLLIFFIYFLPSCVGPPDPSHGLVKNLPVVINSSDIFTFIARGEGLNYTKVFDLTLSVSTSEFLNSTIVVTDFKGSDTSAFEVLDDGGNSIYNYLISGNRFAQQHNKSITPQKIMINIKNFTGIAEWAISAK